MDTNIWIARFLHALSVTLHRAVRLGIYLRYTWNKVLPLEDLKEIAEYFEELINSTSMSRLHYLQQLYFTICAVDAIIVGLDPSGDRNGPFDIGASHIFWPQILHNQGAADPTSEVRWRALSQNTLSNTGSTGVQSSASSTYEQTVFPVLDALVCNLKMQNPMGERHEDILELLQNQLKQGFKYVHQRLIIVTCYGQESLLRGRVDTHMEQLHQQLQILLMTTSEQYCSMQISSSAMQPSMVHRSGLQQNRPVRAQQSAELQDAHFHRWETPITHYWSLLTRQQHFMAPHPNATTDMPQQNSFGDTNEQHQRWPGQPNNLGNLQQHEDRQELAQRNTEIMQRPYLSALCGFSASQMNTLNSPQLASGLNLGQGNAVGPLSQNTVRAPPYTGQQMILEGFDRCSPPTAAISNLKLNAEKEANARKKSKAGKKK